MKTDMKDQEMLEQFIKNHEENYKNAVIEIIKNNTNSLIDEDISCLIKEPPLVSMDIIKQKLLSLAKKEKIVLNDEKLNILLSKYRNKLLNHVAELKSLRNEPLISKIIDFTPKRETETIEILPEDLKIGNKKMKNQLKNYILECNEKILLKDINAIYQEKEDLSIRKKISESFFKYMNTVYQKQLIDSVVIKVLVKDRTLINGVNEQGERYLFTKSNSYIFNNKNLSA